MEYLSYIYLKEEEKARERKGKQNKGEITNETIILFNKQTRPPGG